MKSVLKISLLVGVLLAVFYIVASQYHLSMFPVIVVLIPGGMLFTIADFLKATAKNRHYSYLIGVLLSFLYAIFAMVFCIVLIHLYEVGSFSSFQSALFGTMGYFVGSNLYLVFLSAFLIPLIYLGKSPRKMKSQTNILDEDLLNQ